MTDRTPWAYVSTKDGQFAGAISLDNGTTDAKQKAQWRKEVAKFCGDHIADGFTITAVYDRAEYLALIDGMPMWQPKPKVDKAPLPLFEETE